MATPVLTSKVLTAASANAICLSQTPGAAGAMLLNGASVTGGVATLDAQRRVLVTCAGNNSGVTFTITGTKANGVTISEVMTGPNTTSAATLSDFLTVTSIVISGASTGAVTVGTNTTGSTPWYNGNIHMAPFAQEIDCSLTGSATFSIETTQSDYLNPAATVIVQTTSIAAATAAAKLALTSPVRAWRLTVTLGTGTVTAESIQAGIVNY